MCLLYFREVSLMVANKRPFCPRNAADLHLDDLVKFSRQGGKISRGYVKYIGHLPGKHDTYLGVELEHESKSVFTNVYTCLNLG